MRRSEYYFLAFLALLMLAGYLTDGGPQNFPIPKGPPEFTNENGVKFWPDAETTKKALEEIGLKEAAVYFMVNRGNERNWVVSYRGKPVRVFGSKWLVIEHLRAMKRELEARR